MAERFADELSDLTADEPLPYVDLFVNRARALSALGRIPDDPQALATMQRLEELAASSNLVLVQHALAPAQVFINKK